MIELSVYCGDASPRVVQLPMRLLLQTEYSVVCLSVGLSVTVMSPTKMAEPIDMPFGMWTRMGQRIVLDEIDYWRHLANKIAIEPCMCGPDAALCQITLTAFYV